MTKIIRELEEKIVRTAVKGFLSRGYAVSISGERGHDTEEMVVSTSEDEIVEEAMSFDDCHLFIHKKATEDFFSEGRVNTGSWLYLVFGNDGWDVISDYTMDLEPELKEALALSDQYA